MARLPYFDAEDLPEAERDLLKRPIWLFRCLVNSPGATRAQSALGQYIRFKSKIDPRLRELAILQVGWLAKSAYEWSHHVKIGYDFGVTDADIEGLIAESAGKPSGLDALTSLVLQGAREIHAGGMSEATFRALQQHFTNEQMVDLTIAASFYCSVVRTLATLGIDVEPEYEKYLAKYPFPA